MDFEFRKTCAACGAKVTYVEKIEDKWLCSSCSDQVRVWVKVSIEEWHNLFSDHKGLKCTVLTIGEPAVEIYYQDTGQELCKEKQYFRVVRDWMSDDGKVAEGKEYYEYYYNSRLVCRDIE